MRSILHSLVLAPALMAAAALAPNSAMASSAVNVPFSFTLNGKACPAGRYVVAIDSHHSYVTFYNTKAPVGFNLLLEPADAPRGGPGIILRFDHTGPDYALQTLQYGSGITHRLDKAPRHREHRDVVVVPGD